MKETMKLSLRNHAMNDQSKQDTTVSKSRLNELLSTFLDDASKAKSELMDKEIGTFLVLQGVVVSLLEDPEVSKRGLLKHHSDGTIYFLWDGDKVLKFNPPSMDESILTFDCDRLYLKQITSLISGGNEPHQI
jgi:hypothetical protein